MTLQSNALITQAVALLEKVEGDESETKAVRDCIRQLNAIAISSIIRQQNHI